MKILIVNDFIIMRDGLKVSLKRYFTQAAIGEAATSEMLLQMLDGQSWDALLIDVQFLMHHGIGLLDNVRALQAHLPVLLMSFDFSCPYAMQAMRAGINGYLTRGDIEEKLPLAINKVVGGGRYINPDIAEQLAELASRDFSNQELHDLLSERELAIMSMLSEGKTPKRIAYDLGLSIKTVSTYRGRALKKLKMKSNAEFIRYSIQHNLLP